MRIAKTVRLFDCKVAKTLASSCAALLAGALWTAVPAQAATTSTNNTGANSNDTLEEVVVTSTKRVERLQDVPASIVAESGVELEHRGATQLQDIIDNTPGLSNPGNGGPNASSIVIRGVATGTGVGLKQNTVSLLYDDIPIDPGAQGGGTTNLRVVDIQRVEVLRGPQGTLFGSGSLSGAIRYVTNKPDLDRYQLSAEATGYATENGAGSGNGTVMLNAPLVNGVFGVRAVGYYFNDGGWIYDQKSGRNNINGVETSGGRLIFGFRPLDNLNANLTLMYQKSRDKAGGDSLYTPPPGYGDKQVSDGIYLPDWTAKNFIANLTVQYDFPWASLISSTTYHNRQTDQSTLDYYFVPLTTAIATGFQTIVNGPDYGLYFVHADFRVQELRLTSRDGGPLKWTVGGFFLGSNNSSSQEDGSPLVTPYVGGSNIVDLKATGIQKEYAGFGEATYTLANQWDLTAGVRVSHTKIDSTVTTGGFIPVYSVSPAAYITEIFHETDSPVNPHVSVTYRPTTDLSLYVSAARGFRVGGINETSGVGGRNGPLNYSPDSLWNYEIGAKGRALDSRLSYSADVYYIDWKNIQVDLANQLGNYTGNAGEAHLWGFEGQLDTRLLSWLEAGVSGLVANNKIVKGVSGLSTALGPLDVNAGDLLPASPRLQGSFYTQFDFNAWDHEAYLRFSGRYLGEQWTIFNKKGTSFGAFGTADVRAGIRLNNLELAAFAENVFNRAGRQSAADAQTAGPIIIGNQDAWLIRPRTIGVTARFSL